MVFLGPRTNKIMKSSLTFGPEALILIYIKSINYMYTYCILYIYIYIYYTEPHDNIMVLVLFCDISYCYTLKNYKIQLCYHTKYVQLFVHSATGQDVQREWERLIRAHTSHVGTVILIISRRLLEARWRSLARPPPCRTPRLLSARTRSM